MDVYRQASRILETVKKGHGTAKALCLQKEVQKKKQTYAVVCETLRHYDLLDEVLKQAQFFEYYPTLQKQKTLVMCLTFDVVIGKGINTKQHEAAVAVNDSMGYLQKAYQSCKDHFTIAPREKDQSVDFPRYARANTLLGMSEQDIWKSLRGRKRKPTDDQGKETEENEAEEEVDHDALNAAAGIKWDKHIPQLMVFPPGTDLHAHPLVRRNHIVLQDKASCIPAAVLMNAVPVTRYDTEGNAIAEDFKTPSLVIDGCSAPGNKTTQLAALGAESGIQLMAIERDRKRYELLQKRINQFGAGELVNCVNGDFFNMQAESRDVTEAILLDPSCSASGVVSRVDVSLGAEDVEAVQERVDTLAKIQKSMLTHALLSFDNCWRVVYSTCSVHVQEDEDVVRKILTDERVVSRGWTLSSIMPDTWTTRGHTAKEDGAEEGADIPTERCLRCDPTADKTNGFFVACFDRVPPTVKTVTAYVDKNADGEEGEKPLTKKEKKAAAAAQLKSAFDDEDDAPVRRTVIADSSSDDDE